MKIFLLLVLLLTCDARLINKLNTSSFSPKIIKKPDIEKQFKLKVYEIEI